MHEILTFAVELSRLQQQQWSKRQKKLQKQQQQLCSIQLTHYPVANCIAAGQYLCCVVSSSANSWGCRRVSYTCWSYCWNPWMWPVRFAFGPLSDANASFAERAVASCTSDSVTMSSTPIHLSYLLYDRSKFKEIPKMSTHKKWQIECEAISFIKNNPKTYSSNWCDRWPMTPDSPNSFRC